MKRLLKILKIITIAVVTMVFFLTIATIAFVNMSPQFGDTPADEQQKAFEETPNYRDGKFYNDMPTKLGLTFGQGVSVAWEFFFGDTPGKNPGRPLPMEKISQAALAAAVSNPGRLTWFGHSAILLEVDGSKILLDPMLGQHAGPLPLLSPKRYNSELPIAIDEFPFIDVVIISHDHYDHLDYGSIRKLKDRVGRFYVPLGVGAHLKSWGVKPDLITELNWWEQAQHKDFTFICTPARHFSGRGFTNNTTLWCSWVIQTPERRYYFSGDSGYGAHFKKIGERYGPMDLVMMECGQYNELWTAIHMMPEETVQATLDVQGKLLLPVHWGAFTLSMHNWTDPVVRVTAEAARRDVPVATPKIGEMMVLDYRNIPNSPWWSF